ncbi:MAG: ABC transporter ATP-binding protein, partial [Nitrosomonas sp.]
MRSNAILINNLTFGYGNSLLLENLSLTIETGEIVTLIGASGQGKTTILKLISGLLSSAKGSVIVCNQKHPQAQRNVAMMMQHDLLLPWRTILGNVTIAAEMTNIASFQLVIDAKKLLTDLRIGHTTDMYPEELSGGMRQRVSLARAILQRRPILLLDEPFASLDTLLREQLYTLLRDLRDSYGLTILLVTHDFRDALTLSDRILLLGQGNICQEWTIPPQQRGSLHALLEWQTQLRDAMNEIDVAASTALESEK